MAQQIIVYIIGVAVIVYAAVRLWQLFTSRRNPCAGCSGCDPQKEFRKKQEECSADGRPKSKKESGCCASSEGSGTPKGSTGCGCGR